MGRIECFVPQHNPIRLTHVDMHSLLQNHQSLPGLGQQSRDSISSNADSQFSFAVYDHDHSPARSSSSSLLLSRRESVVGFIDNIDDSAILVDRSYRAKCLAETVAQTRRWS